VCKKREAESTPEVGQAGWLALTGPGPFRPGSVALRSRGSSCIYALCPLHLHHFDDVILTSKIEVLLARSPAFYDSILGDVPL
jgi:hypothetical protein